MEPVYRTQTTVFLSAGPVEHKVAFDQYLINQNVRRSSVESSKTDHRLQRCCSIGVCLQHLFLILHKDSFACNRVVRCRNSRFHCLLLKSHDNFHLEAFTLVLLTKRKTKIQGLCRSNDPSRTLDRHWFRQVVGVSIMRYRSADRRQIFDRRVSADRHCFESEINHCTVCGSRVRQ